MGKKGTRECKISRSLPPPHKHTFSSIVNSTPIPGSGVRISLNKMTPSVLYACQGCKLICVDTSGISERSLKVGYFLTSSR
jgi:hypothetical protein